MRENDVIMEKSSKKSSKESSKELHDIRESVCIMEFIESFFIRYI